MERFFVLSQSFDFSLAAIIFIAYIVIDALYAYYTFAITKRHAFSSANSGLIIHFLLAFGVINYVENYLYIIPLALGSWVGTYAMVKYEHNREISKI
jgi:hypothetical protein